MATRKEYEMLFQLNAQLGSNYSGTFKTAQSAIISMQKEISALGKTQSDISAYQKQQAAVESSRQKLELLQKQYDNIQKEMQETGTYSSALENKLLDKQQQIDKASASLENQTAKLSQMSDALRSAGINTENLAGETAKLGGEIEDLKRKQEAAADKAQSFGTAASSAFMAAGHALMSAGILKAVQEMEQSFAAAAEAAMIFESGMIDVDKTTDLTAKEFAEMSAEIKQLSTEIPVLTSELTDIGETAGQLGIAKENLMDFSEVMAMLSTATTMTAEQGATMLAQFANITQMRPEYYSNLASSLVDLGNNYATTEQKIIDMSQGIAASASLAGITEAEMLGLSAAVTSLGIETQAGSTSMSKLIQELMTAVETGENLKEFASIANMSAEEFSTAWGENAVGALQAFIMGLNDTERNGKSALVALSELGITEVRMQRMILSLANSGDLLNRTLDTSTKAWAENTALVAEAEKRYASLQSQLIMKQNAVNNLKIAIGDNYTPVLKTLYGIEIEVLKGITEFVEKNPELVKAVTAAAEVFMLAGKGLAAFVAITKIAIPLMRMFAASIPGVNIILGVTAGVAALAGVMAALSSATEKQIDESWELTSASREQYRRLQELNEEYEQAVELYGETSYEAQSLSWKIEDLTAEYEASKQTLSEYQSAHEDLMNSYREMTDSHAKAYDEIEKERQSTLALISKLKELASTGEGTAANQQAILSIIEALNEKVPELALSYDDVVNSSGEFADSLYTIAEARAALAKLEQQSDDYATRAGNHEALKSAKEAAEYNAKIAQEEYDLAKKAYEKASFGEGGAFFAKEEEKNIEAAKEHLDKQNATLEETSAAFRENAEVIAELEDALAEYQKAQAEAAAAGEDMNDVLIIMSAEYKEAYEAAIESISGQYELWDKAAQVVATSAGSINQALESQASYWQNYTANIENLSERSAGLEGLSEMIASFADGSEGSVNAIAGMAKATDAELRTMVSNWQKLQEEQKLAADSLAKLEADIGTSMDKIQSELESSVEEMNLSGEAAQSGRSTIEGFIQGAEAMTPKVQAAYKKIAKAGVAAMDAELDIRSPSGVFEDRGEYSMEGYIGGVIAMEQEVIDLMKFSAGAITKSFFEETSRAASMRTGSEAVSAKIADAGSNHIQLIVSPHYEISGVGDPGDIGSVLNEHNTDIKDLVLEIIENEKIESARRLYI